MLYVCPYRQTLGFKAILFCNKSRLCDMHNSASNLNIYTINTGTKINHKFCLEQKNVPVNCISLFTSSLQLIFTTKPYSHVYNDTPRTGLRRKIFTTMRFSGTSCTFLTHEKKLVKLYSRMTCTASRFAK